MRAALALLLGALLAGPAGAQPLTPAAPQVIDGPSPAIQSLSGLSVARDGTGGLAYLKGSHVFVSRLLGGSFQAPQQVDGALGAFSTQPVIAAGNNGLLLVGFVNGGQLYVVDWASAGAPPSSPVALASAASNPAISITTLGKAYLAFTTAGAGGHDVRCAYFDNGSWSVEAAPLDANASDDAGTGTGAPSVAAAGDGVGILAWGEAGHVYTRRVWADSPSVVFEQADVPSLGGWSEVSADQPSIDSGGDSSYAAVAFHEVFTDGSRQQQRVLMQRLHGSRYDGLVQPDGLTTPGAEGAEDPRVAVGEYGQGFVTSGRDSSHQLVGMQLGNNDSPQGVQRIDSLPNAGSPDAVPAAIGFHSALIAWQQAPGSLGLPEIRARFFDGSSLQPEAALSTPGQGPVQASLGIAAAGDIAADGAVAWVQGTGGALSILADQLYQPPGSFGPLASFAYARTTQPTLSWSPARELWGQINYVVSLDGQQVAQTTATSATVPNAEYPAPLSQGPHTWQVTGTNAAGLSQSTRPATVFIDTVAPAVTLSLTGRREAGKTLHLTVHATDTPAPLARGQGSGIAAIQVAFGDHHRFTITRGKFHVYRQPGRYTLKLTVTDRAGNRTVIVKRLVIKPKPKPARRHRRRRHG